MENQSSYGYPKVVKKMTLNCDEFMVLFMSSCGPEDFWVVVYYIGEINTGVPPGLGVHSIWGVGSCINPWF